MTVFVDTNILLDILEKRGSHRLDSEEVLERCDAAGNPVFMAWHTLATAFYIYSRKVGKEAARIALDELLCSVSVATTGHLEAIRAFHLGFGDVEDAMQAVAAEACGASVIVTRNAKDFPGSSVPAVSPREFLDSLP
jgi:predicted nucleic acid-binding protein